MRRNLFCLATAGLIVCGGPAPAQEDVPESRVVSAPGRIDGQAAEKYRQANALRPAQPIPVRVSNTPASIPTPRPRKSFPIGVIIGLAVLVGLAAAGYGIRSTIKKRRAEEQRLREDAERRRAAQPAHRPDDDAALLAAASDEAKRDALADYILRAQKVPDFLQRCRGRSDDFLSAYARSFLKLSAWEPTAALIRSQKARQPREDELCQAMDKIMAARAGRPPAEAYVETLALAAELSRRGCHEDALRLLDAAIIQRAAGPTQDSAAVAGVFIAAGKSSDFLAQAKIRKHPQFYRAYALAFHSLKDTATALELIRMKQPRDATDYALYVSCHKELGRIADISLPQIQDADRLILAKSLLDAGEDGAALKALLENRLEALSSAELSLALSICRKLQDLQTAGRLFQQIKLTIGLADAPELYQSYAMICEAAGRRRDARDVYEEILRRFPDHSEAAERLRRL